jgi:hypothetical protein
MQNNQSARKLITLVFALLLGILGVAAPSFAALEMVEFRIFSLSDRLRLEWETAQEYNLIAFQIYCKEEAQTDAEYHPIGYPIPAGAAWKPGPSILAKCATCSRVSATASVCRRSPATTSRGKSLKFAVTAFASHLPPQ